ncbi:protein angel [Cochliomyia hominivorax]
MLKVCALPKHICFLIKDKSYQKSSSKLLHLTLSDFKKYNRQSLTMNRKWKPELERLEPTDKSVPNYKLLSYNILAQDLLVEHLYLYSTIDNKMLRWDNRLSKLRDEITILMPDILCLQEMQYDHLKELVQWISTANNQRFEYVFKKRTGIRSDGCAIIYDKNKFKFISEKHVEYYTSGISTLNRENIALMVKLKPQVNNSSTFVVATTHLLYNPKREDVRISQVNKLLQSIIDFSQSTDENNHLPVILTGDFNFTHDSSAFQILTALRKRKVMPEITKKDENAEDFFQMECIDFGCVDGASTYQGQWITVDYILKSLSNKFKSIEINNRYILPTVNECCKNGYIPNAFVGSDHFSLAIQFSII